MMPHQRQWAFQHHIILSSVHFSWAWAHFAINKNWSAPNRPVITSPLGQWTFLTISNPVLIEMDTNKGIVKNHYSYHDGRDPWMRIKEHSQSHQQRWQVGLGCWQEFEANIWWMHDLESTRHKSCKIIRAQLQQSAKNTSHFLMHNLHQCKRCMKI